MSVVIAISFATIQIAYAAQQVEAIVAPKSAAIAQDQASTGQYSQEFSLRDCDGGRAVALRAVLRLDGGEGRFASGVTVDSDRVVTAAHAIVSKLPPWVDIDGIQMPAVLLSTDDSFDIAVLEIPTAGINPLRADGNPVGPGTHVLLVGYPYGGQQQTITGEVQRVVGDRIYIDSAVTEGYSGGAIMRCVDAKWSLVGIVVGFRTSRNSAPGYTVGVLKLSTFGGK